MRQLADSLAAVVVLSALVVASGCAPAYRNYSPCCVDCRYCPPSPLPYDCYDPCVCHSFPAQAHLARVATAATAEPVEAEPVEPVQPPPN